MTEKVTIDVNTKIENPEPQETKTEDEVVETAKEVAKDMKEVVNDIKVASKEEKKKDANSDSLTRYDLELKQIREIITLQMKNIEQLKEKYHELVETTAETTETMADVIELEKEQVANLLAVSGRMTVVTNVMKELILILRQDHSQ